MPRSGWKSIRCFPQTSRMPASGSSVSGSCRFLTIN
nr:MAG TPA: hypothetical protein [Caudoviricetes sp.]